MREAVESLLAQTDSDLAVLLVDDCSTDGTVEVAEALAREDKRVQVHRNEHRLGLAGNWRRCLELARSTFPRAAYFAWGSDHDVWDARWLERLAAALDARPSAVLAYPHFARLDETGDVRRRTSADDFTTVGARGPLGRFARTLACAPAGRIVYGLFRADALARTSGFRTLLAPDRLLLLELSLTGEFVQVPDRLWSRRFRHRVSAARQRRSLFPDGAPAWSYAPWWLQHVAALTRSAVGRRRAPLPPRRLFAGAAALFLPVTAWRAIRRGVSWTRLRSRRLVRRVRSVVGPRIRHRSR